MPKLFENQEEARKTIVAAAGRKLRESGFDGIGVDGLMREAGLTSGAFYNQFGSKKELLLEVLNDGFDKNQELFELVIKKADKKWLEKLLKMYLSLEHRSRIAEGCLLPTLSVDAMRAGAEARKIFGERITEMVEKYSQTPLEDEKSVGREKMWAILAIMTGGVLLARAVEEEELAEEILAACRNFVEI